MKIAVLSDSHDNLWNLRAAIAHVQDAEVLICCGDLCSPFVVDELAKFPGDVHVVFGNNDADLYRITTKSAGKPNMKLHGEFFATEFAGRSFAVNHFDYIAKPIARSGQYDVVCFGHNHEFEIGQEGRTLLINPGPIMGAKFTDGWADVAATFVTYDSDAQTTAGFQIDSVTKRISPRA